MWTTNLGKILNKSPKMDLFGDLTDVNKNKHAITNIIKSKTTPIFVVDTKILEKRISDLKVSCRNHLANFQIAYSFKTNYEVGKLKIVKKSGLWAEVVSGCEYKLAKKLGYKGCEIVFNGPSKSDSDLSVALNDGALVFVDNHAELVRIQKIASFEKKKFQIGIRLRTKIPKLDESRFGFSVNTDEAAMAARIIDKDPYVSLVALHMHIGSDIDNPKTYKFAASAMINFIQKNIDDYENKIKFLDFGGGFPSRGLSPFGRLRWNPQPIEKYIEVISFELRKVFKEKKPTLIFEPGRYLVDDAVIFVTKIINSKNHTSAQTLITDATITMLPLVQYRPQIVKLYDKYLNEKTSPSINTVVYGASCRENDILYKEPLPRAELGDILIYFITGAYNQNMGSEFIFKKPLCSEF